MNEIAKVIQNRLGQEIGALKALLMEAQVYNEILIQQNKELQEQLETLKAKEQGETADEPNEEGD